jgi:hypothetical protein
VSFPAFLVRRLVEGEASRPGQEAAMKLHGANGSPFVRNWPRTARYHRALLARPSFKTAMAQ